MFANTYVAGVTKVSEVGNRLSVINYKVRGEANKKPAQCVEIPKISGKEVMDSMDILEEHIVEWLESIQDKIIRAKIDSLEVDIPESCIKISGIVEYLESESTGARLTKVALNDWFDSELSDKLTVRLAEKLGISDTPSEVEVEKIDRLLVEYKNKIASLAGGKTSYTPKIAKSLLQALELGDIDDGIGCKLYGRLVKMRDIDEGSMIDLL